MEPHEELSRRTGHAACACSGQTVFSYFLSIYMSGTWPLPPEQELDFSVSETDPEAGELGKAKLSTGVRIGHACLTKHEETGEDQLWL